MSVLELKDVQDKPALSSTFMMWMLARLYHTLPEVGDLDKPRLVFFFDEAHLLFEGASSAFKEQVEQVARLIRSKGVGVVFVTQSPKDVPADILAQLGNRIQHALRAFTPDDEPSEEEYDDWANNLGVKKDTKAQSSPFGGGAGLFDYRPPRDQHPSASRFAHAQSRTGLTRFSRMYYSALT